VFGVDDDPVGDEVGGVETHAELSDHGNVGSSLKGLHERLCSGLCNCSQVVNEISFGHADARIEDGDGLRLFVGDDLDEELLLGIELGRISEQSTTEFVCDVTDILDLKYHYNLYFWSFV